MQQLPLLIVSLMCGLALCFQQRLAAGSCQHCSPLKLLRLLRLLQQLLLVQLCNAATNNGALHAALRLFCVPRISSCHFVQSCSTVVGCFLQLLAASSHQLWLIQQSNPQTSDCKDLIK